MMKWGPLYAGDWTVGVDVMSGRRERLQRPLRFDSLAFDTSSQYTQSHIVKAGLPPNHYKYTGPQHSNPIEILGDDYS